ncbi:protein PIN-LIKES 3-like [Aristolochia californica]|uniref:protein PIN-LIKES 3-like n=1 Tax=Aristolochia californica TaxID=171875 RepID=UPI0035D82881
MRLLDLFVAATIPVIKVLLMTAVGSILALHRSAILGEDARKRLNNVVFFVFNPALVFSNLSQTITYKSVVFLWFMPLNILITVIVGSVLGWVLIRVTKPPSHLRGLILGCCASGNWGTLLLIIVPAICKEKASPFGDPDVCRTYGLAYVSLSMATGAIFLWSYVYNVVRIFSSESTKVDAITSGIQSPGETSKLLPEGYIDESNTFESDSFDNYIPVDDYADTSRSQGLLGHTKQVEVCVFASIKQCLEMVSTKINLRKLLAPSTIAAIAGFAIGMVPQLRWALIGGDAPLRVIQASILSLGEGAIPTVTLIMGGNLVKGMRGSAIRATNIIGIVIVRYFILPILGMLVVRGGQRLGFIHPDPLYQFVLLIQYAVPPAMNIGTITQLFGAGESECSVIFLWTYGLASVSLTLWSTLFMWLVA